ncbi:MAG: hypothetical protein ACOX2K_01940 [Bacillota bacterium]|jgi:hypothetical protein
MSRAAALVLLVILITIGVWFYLPPTASSVVVFYRQVPADPALAQTGQLQPVFCQTGAWTLSVEQLTLSAQAAGLLKLRAGQPKLDVSLLLSSEEGSPGNPPSLTLRLIDDSGREYAEANLSECGAAEASEGRIAAWRYRFCCPSLAAGTRSISILAQLDNLTFCLPQLSLPR